MTLYRTGKYVDESDDVRGVDVGVATIDLELDAPDDVIGVVPEPSGVTVELADNYDADTLVKLSDASLDRLASERSLKSRSPVPTQSDVAPVKSCASQPSCGAVPCAAPCAAEQCPVTMAEVPCDPSPCARCSKSLDRVGVACPTPCDDVCSLPPAADHRVSRVDEVCQTEPTRSSRASSSRATSLATGTETETDFDDLYSDDTDDISKVS